MELAGAPRFGSHSVAAWDADVSGTERPAQARDHKAISVLAIRWSACEHVIERVVAIPRPNGKPINQSWVSAIAAGVKEGLKCNITLIYIRSVYE